MELADKEEQSTEFVTEEAPGVMRDDDNEAPGEDSGDLLSKRLFRVAWMSIGLGVLLEIALVLIAGIAHSMGNSKPVIVDLVQKITWSFFVCMGLAVGSAVTKMKIKFMGLAGLLAAPAAFYIARAAHKSMQQTLSIAGTAPLAGPSPALLASIKGLEYWFLGMALGWLATKGYQKVTAYLGVGVFTGLTFGLAIVGVMVTMAANPIVGIPLYTRLVNELLFPIGCALVIFSADTIGKRQAK